tara:strand:+ start:541 stop:1677 length:1137 start_codon:yes stop_codon:yes gene_type:complete
MQKSRSLKIIIINLFIIVFIFLIIELSSRFYLMLEDEGNLVDNFVLSKPEAFSSIPQIEFEKIKENYNGICKPPYIMKSNEFFEFKKPNWSCGGQTVRNNFRVNLFHKKTNNKKIFILGGSTVWGVGSVDETTIPSYLQILLNENSINYNVYNKGFTSISIKQQLDLLKTLNLNDQDIVIFYDGGNDIYLSSIYGVPYKSINEYNNENQTGIFIQDIRYFLSKNLAFYTILSKLKNRNKTFNKDECISNKKDLFKNIDEGSNYYLTKINEANKYVNLKNGIFLHFFQPTLGSIQVPTDYEKYLINFNNNYCVVQKLKYAHGIYQDKYNKSESRYLNDLSNDFNSKNLFYDWIHTSGEGNLLIANHIYNSLIKFLDYNS